jgi:Fe-S oxidoreductase
MIRWGLATEGLINTVANRFPGNQATEDHTPNRGLPGDLNWYSYSCAQCGYCVDECPTYYGRGWESQSPRGKWNLLKMVANGETTLTQADVTDFLKCTTCEVCMEKCQLELPIEPSWLKLRGQLVQDKGFHSLPAFHIMEASARKKEHLGSLCKGPDAWLPDDIRSRLKDQSQTVLFPGCTASFVEQDIAISAARILNKAGIESVTWARKRPVAAYLC